MDQKEPESNMYDDNDIYEFDGNASLVSSVSATGSNLSSVTGRQKYQQMLNLSKQQGLYSDIFPSKSAKGVHFQKSHGGKGCHFMIILTSFC